jgi:hypothetical protein
MQTTIQEIYFDLCDLIEENENLLSLKLEGFSEFETLGEFLEEQKAKIAWLEDEITQG